MELSKLLPIIVVALVILIFIMFPEARSLFKGFTRLFIKDMATTPEGAEAIYSEKIDEAQERYNKASDSYKMAQGKLSTAERDLKNLKTKLTKIESECELLVRNNNMDAAALKAEEREETMADIKRYTDIVNAYTEASKQTKDILEACEKSLRQLKRESKETVENMKVKAQINEVYDDLDELKNVSGTDKLLDSIRDKNKDLDALAEGSKAVYNSKLSTRIDKANKQAQQASSNAYLEALKKKYNK